MVTLDKINEDILNLLRASRVSQSEVISPRQIDYHIHNNRALLISRIIAKDDKLADDFFQYLNCIELEVVDRASCPCVITEGCSVLRTTTQLPGYLDEKYLSVMNIDGTQFQIMPFDRAQFNQYRKFVTNDRIAYIRDRYLYVSNSKLLKYITVRGIWEDPSELSEFTDNCSNVTCYSRSSNEYPIPVDLVPMLTQLVLKEFGITLQVPSDQRNDSSPNLETNMQK